MAGRTRRRSSMALMPVVAVCAMLVAAGLALAASGLDAQILMRLRHPDDPAQALGPFWLQRSIRDVTALGSNTVLTVVLLLAALMLGLLGKARWGMGVMVSAAGALAAVTCLKVAFGRDRPDVLPELAVLSPSFPSLALTHFRCRLVGIMRHREVVRGGGRAWLDRTSGV
jgi:undecaprenyl-diphosphatase